MKEFMDMKTKWMLLLIAAFLTLNLRGIANHLDGQTAMYQANFVAQQEATPQPEETPIHEASTPRPPSEAGQNMVLIIGAAMLVLIVFFGLALQARSSRQRLLQTRNGKPPA
jgi:hypothetical protein